MPLIDLVVTVTWVGVLVAALVAQSVVVWLAHRHATRSAREASRLAAATSSVPAGTRAASLRLVPGQAGEGMR